MILSAVFVSSFLVQFFLFIDQLTGFLILYRKMLTGFCASTEFIILCCFIIFIGSLLIVSSKADLYVFCVFFPIQSFIFFRAVIRILFFIQNIIIVLKPF